ncbi:pygopus homolog 1 [Denticeps clupeoides]|uniref:PHD-type domain-containing protein n=1 Tax=Denticeps clupeoides TaxID=299321 RepID=A0AAY4EIG5_9TELE|nr:pygopus homolog 1 [Denticeps clupeoides]
MSAEQDGVKRARGADGGLEGLGGPGVLLGSPDKRKRKSNPQTPSFAPLSEYAPPPNPSADHLVASNPFDDGYSVPSFKQLTTGNPYFGPSHYPGLGGYGPPRMPPHVPNRMPSPYGEPYQMRSQLPLFVHNPMAYGQPDNLNYGNQSMFSNMPIPPGQPFRPRPGEDSNQMAHHSVNQSSSPGPGFGPENAPNSGKPPPKAPQQHSSQQAAPLISKADGGDALTKSTALSTSPRKHSQSSEEKACQDSTPDLKSKTRGAPKGQDAAEKINGVIHPIQDALKKSPPSLDRQRRSSSGGKSAAHPKRPNVPTSAEPVYPCGICLSEVNDDQEAILCDASCQKWFHRVCTGMTETAYNLLAAEASAVWGCDTCMEEKGAQLVRTRDTAGSAPVNIDG